MLRLDTMTSRLSYDVKIRCTHDVRSSKHAAAGLLLLDTSAYPGRCRWVWQIVVTSESEYVRHIETSYDDRTVREDLCLGTESCYCMPRRSP